jgi:hypothetical protein
VIPRLNCLPHLIYTDGEWPENTTATGAARTVFGSHPLRRKLRVLIDNHLFKLPVHGEAVGPEEALSGLLTHPYISYHRYADEGPPADADREKLLESGVACEGWATVDPPDEPWDTRGVTYFEAGNPVTSVAYVAPLDYARNDMRAYLHMNPEGAAAKRAADALAEQVAWAVNADIFITDRAYLYEARQGARPMTLLRPREALAIVGLYLRSQGAYVAFRSPDISPSMGRTRYFTVGAVELLPAVWRWSSACSAASQSSVNDRLGHLAGSLLQRVQSALQARDEVHRTLNQVQDNNMIDLVLYHFDIVTLFLMGAADVTARVAHRVLGLPADKAHHAGWQDTSGWLKKVKQKHSPLAEVVKPETSGKCTLTILSKLRNSIHGETFGAHRVSGSHSEPAATFIRLPQADVSAVSEAIKELGGAELWGIHIVRDTELHADPGVLIDQLFVHTIDLLNKLMVNTPVELLPHVGIDLPNSPPVETHPLGRYSEINRNSIRWQLGF